jgi:outer membrane protein assembly factor BamB
MKAFHFALMATAKRYVLRLPASLLLAVIFGSGSVIVEGDTRNIPESDIRTDPAAKADWRQASFDPAHSGFNRFETVLTRPKVRHLTQLWSAPVSGGIHASPVISNGKVFIGSGDGHMYAFDSATGTTLWIGPTQNSLFGGSAAVTGRLVFAGTGNQPLLAYDADTGEIAWTSDLIASASPTLKDRILYVASFDGTLTAMDAETGGSIWSAEGNCCVPNQSPVVDGGRVFQMRDDHTLTAYNAQTGEQLWSIEAFSVATLAAAYGMLFYSFYPDVVALDQATGTQLWTAPVATAARSVVPAVANGLVFVTHSQLWALDAWTGAVVWSAPVTSAVGPTVANGVVYASSLNGEWDAFDERDGTLLWSVTFGSGCFGTCTVTLPVIANGTLYLAGPDQYLHAFTSPSRMNHSSLLSEQDK